MHFIVAWDIQAEEPRWGEINEAMLQHLAPYPHVRPLTTFYVVKVQSPLGRERIREGLRRVVQEADETVRYVVSPVMEGGRYNGWLPKRFWPEIREKTE